jgi:hypothetical protein
MASAKKVKQFEIIDATNNTLWEQFNELQEETAGVKMEKPTLKVTPGAKISGRVAAHAHLTGPKGSVEKYSFIITGMFKEADNDENVAEFVNERKLNVNRLHSHKMDEAEKVNWELVNKKGLGMRRYTELKATGKIPLRWLQLVEFTSFKEIYAGGAKIKVDDYVTLGNFRWEEKFGGEKDYTGFKNETATPFEPHPFERIEVLSQIAHGWGDYQPLWHTPATLKLPYPLEIDEEIRDTGIDKITELNALKRLKRSHQATEGQKEFFFTALCIPVKKSTRESPVANRSGRLFTAMTLEVKTGGKPEDKGGVWTTVCADRFLMQPDAEGELEIVGIHIEFTRSAIDSFGIKNGFVKNEMVPIILSVLDNGKMWCEVDYLASTEITTVPKSDKYTAKYPIYVNCLKIEFNRPQLIRSIALPITPAYAKIIWSAKIQQDIREAFTAGHPLSYGDDAYNATEFSAPLDTDEYDYYLSHQKMTVADINRLKKVVAAKGWTPEQAAEELSKWLGGKGGPTGDALFAEACSRPEFKIEAPAMLWGIKKELKVMEEEDPIENEAMLLKLYHDWSVNGIEPQIPLPGAKVIDEGENSQASHAAADGEKKKKGHGTKRVKKDAPVLKD